MVGRITASLLMLAAGLLVTAPAQAVGLAVGLFDPPVTVIEPPCVNPSVVADAVGGTDGRIYGFARFSGTGCTDSIWYFEGSGSSWTSHISPYRGQLLGVARDERSTYLLYTDGRNTRITKRAGTVFTPGRAIGGYSSGGDVIAAGGGWWAVWREADAVYQAKTLGRTLKRRPIHNVARSTAQLSLAARPGGGAVLVTCCEPTDPKAFISAAPVFVSADGNWFRRFDIGGYGWYEGVQVATAGRVTWMAWLSVGEVHVTRNRTGRFVRRTFAVSGRGDPRLAASEGKAFLAWPTAERPARVFLAEEAPDGTWTGAVVSPVTARNQQLAAVAAAGGKATVLMMTATRLYARSQP